MELLVKGAFLHMHWIQLLYVATNHKTMRNRESQWSSYIITPLYHLLVTTNKHQRLVVAEPLDYILTAFNQYSVLTTQYNQVQPNTVYCNIEHSLNSVNSTQSLERGAIFIFFFTKNTIRDGGSTTL